MALPSSSCSDPRWGALCLDIAETLFSASLGVMVLPWHCCNDPVIAQWNMTSAWVLWLYLQCCQILFQSRSLKATAGFDIPSFRCCSNLNKANHCSSSVLSLWSWPVANSLMKGSVSYVVLIPGFDLFSQSLLNKLSNYLTPYESRTGATNALP